MLPCPTKRYFSHEKVTYLKFGKGSHFEASLVIHLYCTLWQFLLNNDNVSGFRSERLPVILLVALSQL